MRVHVRAGAFGAAANAAICGRKVREIVRAAGVRLVGHAARTVTGRPLNRYCVLSANGRDRRWLQFLLRCEA